ncbi:tetratricopeptide repeat protein [Streptomyces violaceoruber]|uniref:tetratricopeptide repeat protein n=1 Tax=Streptomyces violaceoruber group TaxID=2867121 RepID=UPI0033F67BD9
MRALKGRAKDHRRAAGKAFSQREIEKALSKPPYSIKFRGQAISDWAPDDAAKAQVPHDADAVWALVSLWCDWAGEAQPDERYWRNLVERAQPARAQQPGLTPVGRPISDYIDQLVLDDLEVHPAVEVSGVTGLGPLPAYVEREHDQRLRGIVDAATSGQSGIALLVGGSSTGKSRACWEAVKALSEGWRLWHPIEPNRAQAVVEQLALVGPQTVVWLNESQHYLLDLEKGEQVASGLRGVLNDSRRGPVLVLGTIWPEHWATLTTVPGVGPDLHAQARQLVKAKGIEVDTRFSADELKDALAVSGADPRIAEALDCAPQGEITQYLAGAPALLERYRTAPAAARALIEAAMDARRLGHGPDLPLSMLEAAVPGYLTDREWDTLPGDWLERAWAYVTDTPACRGAHSPLYRPRPRSGQPTQAQPQYRLADYLEQHGRLHRRTVRLPADVWGALVDHANPTDRIALGEAAGRRGLLQLGFRLYAKAAELGDPEAYKKLIFMLEPANRVDEAFAWCRHAVANADTPLAFPFVRNAVRILREAGRADEADEWVRARAEAGDPYALGEVGRTAEALAGYERAAQGGDAEALAHAGALLRKERRIDEAIDHFQRASRCGSSSGDAAAADLLEQRGRAEEVIDWLRECAERDASRGLMLGMQLLRTGKAEDFEEAFDWYQRAAEANNPIVIGYATNQMRRMIEIGVIGLEDAIEWLEGLAEARHGESLGWAAELLREAGQEDKALDWYRRSAERDNPRAMSRRAELLRRKGRAEEAIDWLKELSSKGSYPAVEEAVMREAADLLHEEGRTREAIDWLRDRANEGDIHALVVGAGTLRSAGQSDEALDWYLAAANAGYFGLEEVASLLHEKGQTEEAARLLQYGLEPSGSVAEPWDAWPPRD